MLGCLLRALALGRCRRAVKPKAKAHKPRTFLHLVQTHAGAALIAIVAAAAVWAVRKRRREAAEAAAAAAKLGDLESGGGGGLKKRSKGGDSQSSDSKEHQNRYVPGPGGGVVHSSTQSMPTEGVCLECMCGVVV